MYGSLSGSFVLRVVGGTGRLKRHPGTFGRYPGQQHPHAHSGYTTPAYPAHTPSHTQRTLLRTRRIKTKEKGREKPAAHYWREAMLRVKGRAYLLLYASGGQKAAAGTVNLVKFILRTDQDGCGAGCICGASTGL